mgnify:FL=1
MNADGIRMEKSGSLDGAQTALCPLHELPIAYSDNVGKRVFT